MNLWLLCHIGFCSVACNKSTLVKLNQIGGFICFLTLIKIWRQRGLPPSNLCPTSLNLGPDSTRERRVTGKRQGWPAKFSFLTWKKNTEFILQADQTSISISLVRMNHMPPLTCKNSGQLSVLPGHLLSGQKAKKEKGIKQCLIPTILKL